MLAQQFNLIIVRDVFMSFNLISLKPFMAAFCAVFLLAACGGNDAATQSGRDNSYAALNDKGKSFDTATKQSRSGIGVNAYLWRASLDAISFLPLVSADPFGGTIITDWYSSPDMPSARIKVTIYILDQRLRADGLRVATFRQTRQGNVWTDASVSPETARHLENAILTRAREMRIAGSNAEE